MKKKLLKSMLAALVFGLVLTALSAGIFAATSEVNQSNTSDPAAERSYEFGFGQVFTVDKTGTLDQIDVRVKSIDVPRIPDLLDIRVIIRVVDEGTGLPTGGDLAVSDWVTIDSSDSLDDWRALALTTPLAVEAGDTYAFLVVKDLGDFNQMTYRYSSADVYEGGSLVDFGMGGWHLHSDEDVFFQAWLTPAEYTVTFVDGAHGTVDPALAVQTVEYGEDATEPNVTPEPGWAFLGWVENQLADEIEVLAENGIYITDFTNIIYDREFMAVYEMIDYTVTFESNGGTAVDSQTPLNYGDLVVEPTDPTKDGFTFEGWFVDEALTTEWDFAVDTVEDDMTLYAKWAEVVVPLPQTGQFGILIGALGTVATGGTVIAALKREKK